MIKQCTEFLIPIHNQQSCQSRIPEILSWPSATMSLRENSASVLSTDLGAQASPPFSAVFVSIGCSFYFSSLRGERKTITVSHGDSAGIGNGHHHSVTFEDSIFDDEAMILLSESLSLSIATKATLIQISNFQSWIAVVEEVND